MGAKDRTERAEFNPAREELRVDGTRHMSTDVVTPIGVANVGRGGGEPRLEGQRIPHGDGVTRESDLIAMVAKSTPAMEENAGACPRAPGQ